MQGRVRMPPARGTRLSSERAAVGSRQTLSSQEVNRLVLSGECSPLGLAEQRDCGQRKERQEAGPARVKGTEMVTGSARSRELGLGSCEDQEEEEVRGKGAGVAAEPGRGEALRAEGPGEPAVLGQTDRGAVGLG